MPVVKRELFFKPGDPVRISGIYNVTHDPKHRDVHQVICVKGYLFAPCRRCEKARFQLALRAVHIQDAKNVFLLEPNKSAS
jgi:hypothetical protein